MKHTTDSAPLGPKFHFHILDPAAVCAKREFLPATSRFQTRSSDKHPRFDGAEKFFSKAISQFTFLARPAPSSQNTIDFETPDLNLLKSLVTSRKFKKYLILRPVDLVVVCSQFRSLTVFQLLQISSFLFPGFQLLKAGVCHRHHVVFLDIPAIFRKQFF